MRWQFGFGLVKCFAVGNLVFNWAVLGFGGRGTRTKPVSVVFVNTNLQTLNSSVMGRRFVKCCVGWSERMNCLGNFNK